MNKKIQKLIYKSFDTTLSAREKQQLDRAAQESAEVQKQLHELEILRRTAAKQSASFQPNFTERVVKTIAATKAQVQDDFFAALSFMFRRIAIAGAVSVILMLSVTLFRDNSSTIISDYAQSQTTLEELIVPSVTTSLEELL